MAHKTADCLHDFEILEIEVKIAAAGVRFKDKVFGRKFMKLDIVAPAGEKFLF